MKVNVRVREEWLLIPVKSPKLTVECLGSKALGRYRTLKEYDEKCEDAVLEVRKSPGGALFFPEDFVEDVVDDGGFLYTVLKNDQKNGRPPSSTMQQEMHLTNKTTTEYLSLDGYSLSTDDLMKLGEGDYNLKLTDKAWEKVTAARDLIDKIVKENKVVYGVTTGFGNFARVVIPLEKIKYPFIGEEKQLELSALLRDTRSTMVLAAIRIAISIKRELVKR